MEVSNEIKEDIRKTQSDLKNAIRVHQVWVARLQEDVNNIHLITKVKEAEKDIITIGQTQKLVVDRLRRELELYQQRLKARNKQINIENDNRYVAQQLRDHQLQYSNRNRTLLKPSVLNEIHVKTENSDNFKDCISDSDNELKSSNEKENSNHSDSDERDKYRNDLHIPSVHDSRNNFAKALNKFKEQYIEKKLQHCEWQEQHSDSGSSHGADQSPTPSPPPLPQPGEPVTQETFMRLIGLVTPSQKEVLEKKRNERRKRSTTSTNRNDFLYGNYEMMPVKPMPEPEPEPEKEKEKAIIQPVSNITNQQPDVTEFIEEPTEEIEQIFRGIKIEVQGLDEEAICELGAEVAAAGGVLSAAGAGGTHTLVPLDFDPGELITASAEPVTVFWVKDCLSQQELLPIEYYHRPVKVPQWEGNGPLQGVVASLSTYSGIERAFLDELAKLLGATYTTSAQNEFQSRSACVRLKHFMVLSHAWTVEKSRCRDAAELRKTMRKKYEYFVVSFFRQGLNRVILFLSGSWSNKPAWAASLPEGLSVEPVYSPNKKVCHSCGRNDVPSLLVWCVACSVWQHTGCGAEGRCASCRAPLPEPACSPHAPHPRPRPSPRADQMYRDKLAERKRLQERNIELCVELRKLEARAASLKENLDEHNAEKRQLLADQIKTQRNLQKLLDFISHFKETSISMRATSASESGSDISKSNEE
ncbi:hypothetical protein evm_006379 [Chilo suppressalis]|nr:hypothetical protein evm_006379 [Chilo suppressalis]